MKKINNTHKLVSVIVPCRNEEKYIEGLLNNILNQDYPSEFLQVLIVDGLSTDRTTEIIKCFIEKHKHIKLLENCHKTVPYGLNQGLKSATGEVIIRIDAHSIYPNNYISELVSHLFDLKADNVGGVWETTPASQTIIASAIAVATSSAFGIGNAHYRLANNAVRQVDTVPFGCYRREVFDKIGLFDEDLTRNQDDEFNGRLINAGGRIFLIPNLKIIYFSRSTLSKMSKMFYQYGLFKPLVNKKLGSPATIRQLVPPIFVLLLLSLPISLINPIIAAIFFSALTAYFTLSIAVSISICIRQKKIELFILPMVFFLIHLSYGFGYLVGIVKFIFLNDKVQNKNIALSR